MDSLRLTTLAAFVATGLALTSFLMLLVVCLTTVGHGVQLAGRIPLVYVMGTIAGLSLFYARWEYANLREERSEGADS